MGLQSSCPLPLPSKPFITDINAFPATFNFQPRSPRCSRDMYVYVYDLHILIQCYCLDLVSIGARLIKMRLFKHTKVFISRHRHTKVFISGHKHTKVFISYQGTNIPRCSYQGTNIPRCSYQGTNIPRCSYQGTPIPRCSYQGTNIPRCSYHIMS